MWFWMKITKKREISDDNFHFSRKILNIFAKKWWFSKILDWIWLLTEKSFFSYFFKWLFILCFWEKICKQVWTVRQIYFSSFRSGLHVEVPKMSDSKNTYRFNFLPISQSEIFSEFQSHYSAIYNSKNQRF